LSGLQAHDGTKLCRILIIFFFSCSTRSWLLFTTSIVRVFVCYVWFQVTELAPLGSLYDFLINCRDRITFEHFRVWAAQVAKGKNFYLRVDKSRTKQLAFLLLLYCDFGKLWSS
jgi:hypothetical protein